VVSNLEEMRAACSEITPPMINLCVFRFAVVSAITLPVIVSAQVSATTDTTPSAPADIKSAISQDLTLIQDALKQRGELADAVAGGLQKPQAALERLRTANFPAGLKLEPDAGFGMAAIDIGQRLVLRHPAEAEVFFRAAEAALAAEVKRTPNTRVSAKDKAQYLQQLAFIRGKYLNQPVQAAADLQEAVKLHPEDKYLAQLQKRMQAQAVSPLDVLQKKEAAK